ncbi:MAG: FAD-binding oxidoreductase, partial [Halioglobus sp.]|nr:FAD-binding oxidoreductase [Halioglobus sp.]
MGRPLNSGSWGRLAFADAAQTRAADWRFTALPQRTAQDSFLPRGWGRSYGDVCINSGGSHLDTTRLDRFVAFDTELGLLRCEAGLTLAQILEVVVPQGWFIPVLPGTRFVTLGGAIGNDVHGKNHRHAGSFGCHVRSLTLRRSDGECYHCDSENNAELFAATIGGLGLTGLILDAEIQLLRIESAQVECEDLSFSSVAEFAALYEESADWAYTVSWIDCFARGGNVGRGISSRARHASG